ncbi:VVA0879 family protein [Paenibacillus woosongensis]|uniref:Uncharacterized protein n=1 Tax=Paenibacillus woosongensis TaxID=307580 RepID=A0A7X2Z0Y7_9BACL|nr:VVA0879 family protein [Paenibacillus woosongensis]MUG45487.1 hypothetical protein [Paenibacillus woosongensis]
MIKQALLEWRTEAVTRFGEKTAFWKFVCPKCGNVQSPKDFVDVGIDQEKAANMSYQGCIGRAVKDQGCNWAAYGFLGTMGKGRIIIAPDGREVEVFDFADPENEK